MLRLRKFDALVSIVTHCPVKFLPRQSSHTPCPIVTLSVNALILDISRLKLVGVPRKTGCVNRTTYQPDVSVGGGTTPPPVDPMGRTERIVRPMLNRLRSVIFPLVL